MKFGEYLCCGLPIISNYSIKVVSDFIQKSTYGYLFEKVTAQISSIQTEELKIKCRNDISAEGIRSYGTENITKKYLELYSSML